MASFLLQAPGETLDYSVDWTNELSETAPADSIAASAWSIAPNAGSPGPSLSGATVAGMTTTTKVSGLAFGVVYRLTNRVETAQGVILERSLTIRCHKH